MYKKRFQNRPSVDIKFINIQNLKKSVIKSQRDEKKGKGTVEINRSVEQIEEYNRIFRQKKVKLL